MINPYHKFLEETFSSPRELLADHPHSSKLIKAIAQIINLFDLQQFNPELVGTQPLLIDNPKSDIDIICYSTDLNYFKTHIRRIYQQSVLNEGQSRNQDFVTVQFELENYQFELFCQSIPPRQQAAFQHMVIEGRLLYYSGEDARHQIKDLKNKGIKTEPAFAQVFNIQGDPYEELLKLYKKPLNELQKWLQLA